MVGLVLQAHEGLSDGEACVRLERDLAWQAAAGPPSGPSRPRGSSPLGGPTGPGLTKAVKALLAS